MRSLGLPQAAGNARQAIDAPLPNAAEITESTLPPTSVSQDLPVVVTVEEPSPADFAFPFGVPNMAAGLDRSIPPSQQLEAPTIPQSQSSEPLPMVANDMHSTVKSISSVSQPVATAEVATDTSKVIITTAETVTSAQTPTKAVATIEQPGTPMQEIPTRSDDTQPTPTYSQPEEFNLGLLQPCTCLIMMPLFLFPRLIDIISSFRADVKDFLNEPGLSSSSSMYTSSELGASTEMWNERSISPLRFSNSSPFGILYNTEKSETLSETSSDQSSPNPVAGRGWSDGASDRLFSGASSFASAEGAFANWVN
jgi:hypothetical protein